MSRPTNREGVIHDVTLALAEDIGSGDLTAKLIAPEQTATAEIICRDAATICGTPWVDAVYQQLEPSIKIDWRVTDGEQVTPNTLLATLTGPARALLTGERTALNFLQTLSATATTTASYVARLKDFPDCRLLDSRKTIPGLRLAQKYAVTCGGATNHRVGLYDAILIKENHIISAGSIANAVAKARQVAHDVLIEVEVENLDELAEALATGAPRIMLDNFSHDLLREAVEMTAGRAELEASGNITLDTLAAVAATGVDFISTGAITKNIQAIDLSMRLS